MNRNKSIHINEMKEKWALLSLQGAPITHSFMTPS